MSELAAVLLALATAAGALAAWPLPRWCGMALVMVAILVRRPALLWLGCALLASSLAASAWAGLEPPPIRTVHARVALFADPVDVGGAVRAVVRLGHRHVEVSARGGSGAVLGQHLAGERVFITGQLTPIPSDLRRRLGRRHLSGRVAATEVRTGGAGNPPSRVANGLRRLLVKGAVSLPVEQRTLFTGFVLGDDRGQSIETVDDFRSSGLSHLLVVSGENVAFVLALAGPALRRLGLTWRVIAGLGVLALFGVMTRWEPSVLRAEAMAAIALGAAAFGRPVSTLRLLALAVTAVLLVDPLLVGSVGFLLSVGACTGIALFARRLTEMIPGPRTIASGVGVTLAAQAGVAPVLVPVFGALPVVTLPANLLAMPAAGPVMVWGVVAGLPAGVVGGRTAALLHLPTRVMVAWVAGVARTAARAPLGSLGVVPLVAIAGCIAVALLAGPRPAPPTALRPDPSVATTPGLRRVRVVRVVAIAAAVAIVLMPLTVRALGRQRAMPGTQITDGATLWRSGPAAVLVVDRPKPDRLLEALRASGTTTLDLLVVRYSGAQAGAAVAPLLHRLTVRAVLAPAPLAAAPGAVIARIGTRARAGPFLVTVVAVAPHLDLRIEHPPAGAAATSPAGPNPGGR